METQIYDYVRPGSGCAKLRGILLDRYESALVDFFVHISMYPSIYPIYRRGYRFILGAILTHNGSNGVCSQLLVFWGLLTFSGPTTTKTPIFRA